MDQTIDSDIAIIGGGPGGYVAAIRASRYGLSVVLVEKDKVGGTCLNRGCIPTKALLRSVEVMDLAQRAENFGIKTGVVSVDFPGVMQRKEAVVRKMVTGLRNLLTGQNVNIIRGQGRLSSPGVIRVTGRDGRETIVKAKNIILAQGSLPSVLSIPGAEGKNVLDSTGILELTALPKSLAVIGGGVIGLEFATIFAGFGSRVTVIEALPGILQAEDDDVVAVLRRSLKKKDINIIEEAAVTAISDSGTGKTIAYEVGGHAASLESEVVLIAVGRRPNREDMGLADLAVNLKEGWIDVSERMETSCPGIYAVGDATGQQQLAHVAFAQAEVAVDNITGRDSVMDYEYVPRAIYTLPELAAVGLTEKQAREKWSDVATGTFPFIGNARAATMDETRGLVKVVSRQSTGEILGVHICGPGATELIAGAAAAMRMKAGVDTVGSLIHAHPTLSEAFREAALDVTGMTVHVLPKRRTR